MLTIAAFGLLVLARWWKGAAYVLLALQALMAINVITHVAGAIAIGGYEPGLITALLVEAPVSVTVWRWRSRRVDR